MDQLTCFEHGSIFLFKQSLEGGRIGTWYWDINTDQYEWSDLCKKYLELPEGKAPSIEHLYSVLHPEDKLRIERLLVDAFANNVDCYHLNEYRIINSQGMMRWISASWNIHRDSLGHPSAMAGIIIDITEPKTTELKLKEANEALTNSEQRFQLAMEAAQEGLWDWRLDTGEVYYSPGYAQMLGYSPQRLKPHANTWIELLHPDERDSVIKESYQRLSNPGDYSLEFRLQHADGSYRWILSKGKVVARDYMAEPQRAVGTHMDITERKEAEARLTENQYQLNLALAGAELGTWDVDIRTGRSIYDERYCAMLGYRMGEIEPTMEGWLRLIHPDDLVAVHEAMRTHLAGETRIYEAEYRHRHKAGHWLWMLARGKATYDATGQAIRATGTMLDITDRKRVSTEGSELLRKFEALIAGLGNNKATQQPHNDEIKLSPRNRQVLGLIAAGLTSVQIAERLGVSNNTAMTHRRNLMRKLSLKNKAELIRYAIKHNIVSS